jgi:hypothetical protein
MLPGFSAASSLHRSGRVYRTHSTSYAGHISAAAETVTISGTIGSFKNSITPATPPCVGPNCPGPWTPIAECGPPCIQGWTELLNNCTYNCKTEYSGPDGESGPNQYACDLQCQAQFGPSNWKCDCPLGGPCVNGQCGCPQGTTRCGDSCTVVATDPKNCGTCGNACVGGQICQNGACSCPSGQTLCHNLCVDISTDSNNCGTCGNICTGGQSCQNGECLCPSGETPCAGICTDTGTDSINCGKCGQTCPIGDVCVNGACTLAPQIKCDKLIPDCVANCMKQSGWGPFNLSNCDCCCNGIPGSTCWYET